MEKKGLISFPGSSTVTAGLSCGPWAHQLTLQQRLRKRSAWGVKELWGCKVGWRGREPKTAGTVRCEQTSGNRPVVVVLEEPRGS